MVTSLVVILILVLLDGGFGYRSGNTILAGAAAYSG